MRIGHYLRQITGAGGTLQYIERLVLAQSRQGHEVQRLGLAKTADAQATPEVIRVAEERDIDRVAQRYGFDILHFHGPADISRQPASVARVRTIHGSEPYCLARNRYLPASDRVCTVRSNLRTCTWHHVRYGCERPRPGKILRNWLALRTEARALPTMPLICPSTYVRDEMERAGYPSERLVIVPHAHFPKHRRTSRHREIITSIFSSWGALPLKRASAGC